MMHNASTVTLFLIIGKNSKTIFHPVEKMAFSAFLVDQSEMRKKKFVDFNVSFAIENIKLMLICLITRYNAAKNDMFLTIGLLKYKISLIQILVDVGDGC